MAALSSASSRAALAAPVLDLPGVGPDRAAQLDRLGIRTIEELLLHRPRRHEDRRHFRTIAELTKEEPGTVRGKIVAQGIKRYRGGSKSIFEFVLDDGTARLHCRWWNLPFMEKYFAVGDDVFVYGKLSETRPRTMDHPETEVIEGGDESSIHINRIAPVYPLTEGLPQRWLRGLIWRTLEKFEPLLEENVKWSAEFPSRANAVRMIHFPEDLTDVEIARRRLALEEFVELQLAIQRRRRLFESKTRALRCGGNNQLMKPFLARLEFSLTGAQTRVLRDIRADMSGNHPMRRLLQGDVGSGKTVVAACAALMAIESGFDIALMSPTEILAEQHFRNFARWFEPLGIRVELKTGTRRIGEATKRRTDEAIRSTNSPTRSITIGTHALIEAGFAPERLGLVIIDEQHKFGVAQRERLVRKGVYPHLLVMTATPIPRTLGLTLYGDLDISVINEMPPGRGHVKTFVRTTETLPKVWGFIREKLREGRQAYIVYPRAEEEDTASGLKAVAKEFKNVGQTLSPFRVGLLHGKLKSVEKEAVMSAFRSRHIHALLATALIEVGVDVSNATVMLVENADRFGLAQLHQLRGRIGRGAHDAYCILVATTKSSEAQERLKVLEETDDGFRIAEADLKLRGPGELLGQQQSGLPRFRFGDLQEDIELLRKGREIAAKLLAAEGVWKAVRR